MNRSKRIVLLIVTVILMVFIAGNFVFAEDGLYQNLDEAAENSGDTNLITYRDNYYLDTEKITFFKNPMATVFDGLANALFAAQKGLATLQISLFQMALESSILDILKEFVTPFIDSMRTYLFDTFSLFMISICAVVLIIKLAVNRQAQAITGLLQILIVVTLAFTFYNHPVQMLKCADDVTKDISDSVMSAPYEAVNGKGADENMSGKVASLVFNLMVHKPWQITEFGSVSKAKEYETDILKYAPESDDRKDLVKSLADEHGFFSKSSSYQLGRIMTLLVVGLLNLLIFLFLTAFCVLIVGYQFLILVYMMLGIFVFMLALIPYFGIELIKRWGVRILSACATKILLAFFLSLILVFMDAMYKFTDTKGLLYTMFMMIVIIAMIYIKKKEIAGLFTDFRGSNLSATGTYQSMNRALDKDLNIIDNLSAMRKTARNEQEAPASLSGSSQRSTTRTEQTQKHSQAGSESFGNRYDFSGSEMKEAASSVTRSTQDMSRYLKKAEELLQKQYEKSKTEAEETAERKGSEPEYGNFVRRTDAVRSLGAGRFDQRDISSVARIMQRVEKNGGDVENVIAGSSKELHRGEVQRPASLSDRSNIDQNTKAVEGEASGQNVAAKTSNKGIDYFKETFGEEKGEEFYASMARKYDAIAVDNFSSESKLTYAQVQRQLKESEKAAKQSQEPVRERSKDSEKKSRPVVTMRGAGDAHGKEEG